MNDLLDELIDEEYTEEDDMKTENVTNTFKYELELPEYSRKTFKFKYQDDKTYKGVPLKIINENKIVFLVNDKMQGFYLSDIKIL